MPVNADATWADRTAKAVLLIRILVGWVFLSEGIQKFLFPDSLGVGRFVKIGIPWPQVMAPFVGVVEIVCGSLLLIGLITRLATVPLLIDIAVALYSTKIVTLAKNGLWGTLHEARTDVSMLLGLIFLLLVGAGAWSLDAWLAERRGAVSWLNSQPFNLQNLFLKRDKFLWRACFVLSPAGHDSLRRTGSSHRDHGRRTRPQATLAFS